MMDSYYSNVNQTLLDVVDVNAKTILELGCGGGGLASAIKKKLGPIYYAGVEVFPDAMDHAKEILDVSLLRDLDRVTDWDADDQMRFALPHETFDHVICGDVLEHLRDPEKVLEQAVLRLKIGGSLLVCIPNVQHWSVFGQLVLGSWPRNDSGLFDKTHLRWFTLNNMLELLATVGLHVEVIIPRIFEEAKGRDFLEYLEPLADRLGVDFQEFQKLALPLQYVLVAKKTVSSQGGDGG